MINGLLFTLLAWGEKEVAETKQSKYRRKKDGCEDGVCILSGTITEDEITSDNVYFFQAVYSSVTTKMSHP